MSKRTKSGRTIYWWMDSGANIHSCNYGKITLDELGITDEKWDAMSEDEREELMKPLVFDQVDWGFSEDKPEGYQ